MRGCRPKRPKLTSKIPQDIVIWVESILHSSYLSGSSNWRGQPCWLLIYEKIRKLKGTGRIVSLWWPKAGCPKYGTPFFGIETYRPMGIPHLNSKPQISVSAHRAAQFLLCFPRSRAVALLQNQVDVPMNHAEIELRTWLYNQWIADMYVYIYMYIYIYRCVYMYV